jgi:hypothetical protein
MSMENDLGTLICVENPYPNKPVPNKPGMKYGDMEIVYVGLPKDADHIKHEIQDNYPDKWKFKNDPPHHIARVLEVGVRYPIKDASGTVVDYKDDVLLIGYAGSGGGS